MLQNNLATAYQGAGKLAQAIELFEQLRDQRIAKLGADHLDTISTLATVSRCSATARTGLCAVAHGLGVEIVAERFGGIAIGSALPASLSLDYRARFVSDDTGRIS